MTEEGAAPRAHSQGPGRDAPEAPRRPVVMLIAYSCVPGEGSESGVGWTWAKAASEFADVILLTHSNRFRSEIETTVATLGLSITPCFVDPPLWLIPLFKGKVLGTLQYCVWQALAGRAIRRYERDHVVDAVHHLTWASDSLPSALLASHAPVRVWGPVGGVTRTARGLYRYLTPRGKLNEIVRGIMNGIIRATWGTWLARHATLVVALNQDVEARYRSGPTPVIVASNMALESDEVQAAQAPAPSNASDHRVALFVGRLVPLKGLVLAVQSLQHAPNWKLVVLGDGPERSRAMELATRIGVEDRLLFRGEVPRGKVLAAFATADALLFPSFHDSGPWAVGEATSMGCPVVCLDTGGPALQAGRNAHVVTIEPAATLPQRIGARLEGLSGRGVPDDTLRADRIPGVLKAWYSKPDGSRRADDTSRVPVVGSGEPNDD